MIIRERANRLIENGLFKNTLAKKAGVSNSTIGRFLDGGSIDFSAALKLVQTFWQEDEKSLLEDLCISREVKNRRHALEYALISGNKRLSELLVKELTISEKRYDREWASVYQIELRRNSEAIDPHKILEHINNLCFETLEMEVYSLILSAYAHFDLKHYAITKKILLDSENKLRKIKTPLIRQCFIMRVGQVMAYLYLQENNIMECRRYHQMVLENAYGESLLASVYNGLGQSFMFECAQTAIDYLEKARRIYCENGRAQFQRKVENTINFVQSLHNLEPTYLRVSDQINDLHDMAHSYIRKGKLDLALKVMNQINYDAANIINLAFHYYYLGLIHDDPEHFFESITKFNELGDKFLRQLPLRELNRLGLSKKLLKALSI